MSAPTTADAPLAPPGRDTRVIALIGFAHGVSHFFHLLLPPLFPWLMDEFHLDYVQVGATMTAFFVVSGIGQALAGLLVDRVGPIRVLAAGIGCFVLAGFGLALADGLGGLMAVAVVAGLGNSVFHPCDFSVLNRNVSQPRLGHAFSVHSLSGNLGWALAPLFMTGIASTAGWRVAGACAGLVALPALALVLAGRRHLADVAQARAAGPNVRTADILRVGPVWLCFVFFLLLTAAFGAFQNFGAPIAQHLYGLSLTAAAGSLSAYLLAGAVGIVLGGFLTQRGNHDRTIALGLAAAAGCALVLASGLPEAWAVLPLMAAIGFLTGLAGPSRDMLVRQAATTRFGQSAYGRVYGFVYSGLDAGLALAPLLFGGLMNAGAYGQVLAGVALLQAGAIVAALRVGRG